VDPLSAPVFPFFVGCGRSGTTLLRAMFDAHPDVAIVYESAFVAKLGADADRYQGEHRFRSDRLLADLRRFSDSFPHFDVSEDELRQAWHGSPPDDYPDAVRQLYRLHAEKQGKARYGDKSPAYVMGMPLLAQLFPEGRFVHIIRDGRDVASAYLARPWGPSTVEQAALYWRRRVGQGRRDGQRLGAGHYREVRFEALVEDPEAALRSLCDFVEVDFDPAMLRYYERADAAQIDAHPGQHRGLSQPPTKGMRDWRSELDPDQVSRFEVIAGGLLAELGYERGALSPSVSARWAAGRGVVLDVAQRGAGRAGKAVGAARRRADRDRPEPVVPAGGPLRLPDFVIIGMMKSGTSSLYQWLGGHPDCGLSAEKEPDFFTSEQAWNRGPGWYGGLFAHVPDGSVLGEASTSYTKPFCDSALAAQRMADTIPKVRLIYVLRHPLDRMRSHYLHEIRRSRETRPFVEAIAAAGNPYVELSHYHRCLLPYLEHFDREQICVVTAEELWEAPHRSWYAVLDHLGLDHLPPPDDRHNVTADKPQFTKAMLRLWSSGRYQQVERLTRLVPKLIRGAGRALLVREKPADDELRRSADTTVPAEIADDLWADVAHLESWLGVSAPLWTATRAATKD
jgi:hypothetical protein